MTELHSNTNTLSLCTVLPFRLVIMPVNTLFLEMPTVSLFEFTLNLCLIKHYYIFAVEYLTQLIVEFDNSKCFVNLEKRR